MSEMSWHLPDPQTQPDFYADVNTKRLVAFVVDTVVILAMCLGIVLLTAFTGLFFFPLLVMIVGFAYRVVTITRSSATWGMRLTAIEFRARDGTLFDLGLAFAHTLGLTISFVMPILQLISIVLMLTNDKRQGLSDILLGSVVINRRANM